MTANDTITETSTNRDDAAQARIAELERRIGELEAHITQNEGDLRDLRMALDFARRDARILYALANAISDWVFIKDRDHRYVLVNQSYADSLHLRPSDLIGKNDLELGFPEYIVKGDPARGIRGFWTDDLEVIETRTPLENPHDPVTLDGEEHIFSTLKTPLYDEQGEVWAVLGIGRDITEREAADLARRQSLQHESLIEAQQAVIRELSTPLIPVADGVVVMPIVGTVESMRAMQILDTLLSGISEHHAHTALLDITGVKLIDTQIAAALIRAAQAARLLGTEVILTGISPEVAQTLVHIGADLTAIKTQASLQRAIAYALHTQANGRVMA